MHENNGENCTKWMHFFLADSLNSLLVTIVILNFFTTLLSAIFTLLSPREHIISNFREKNVLIFLAMSTPRETIRIDRDVTSKPWGHG
jgi:hypothetical protein